MTNKDKIKEVEDYFAYDAISQSKLKTLLLSPQMFKKEVKNDLYFEEKEHFILGSAVDFLFTFNGDMDFFNEYYYVSEIENKPTDVVKSIIHNVFDKAVEIANETNELHNDINEYKEFILEICKNHGYYNNLKDDTRIDKICTDVNREYFWDLTKSIGKTVISKEDMKTIIGVYTSITENGYTKKYFDAEKYEILNQISVYFDIEGTECKALLDRVCIDHKAKTIQIIDFKTIGDYTTNFHRQLKKFRYDIQAAFYQYAMEIKMEFGTKDVNEISNYEMLPFIFIVESTLQQGTPMIYTLDKSFLEIGKYGKLGTSLLDSNNNVIYKTQPILGYLNLLEMYYYYLENGFETDITIKENNHNIVIDWYGWV